MNRFTNREQAGRLLGEELRAYAGEDTIVLGLPRGGVPVAFEVARALRAPLDVRVVRKLGVPWHPELGVGAVAEEGHIDLNADVLKHVGLSEGELSRLIEAKRREVQERVQKFRAGRPQPELQGRTVILVDDGIATGGTVRAAIRSVRTHHPRQIVLAVPVAAPDTLADLAPGLDRIVCLMAPPNLYAIGLWYEDFQQVDDDEVAALLERARSEPTAAPHPAP
jgi:putative phosphoribosyl transferase